MGKTDDNNERNLNKRTGRAMKVNTAGEPIKRPQNVYVPPPQPTMPSTPPSTAVRPPRYPMDNK